MAQSNHIRDREKDKFDSDGNVKVSIESNNATAQDQDVVVKNTSSEPVPVSIVNPDANIDLEVTVSPSVTIDDSTPIDVNVTNSSVNTNATIQGTPAVTISGNVDIDDATAIRVDVTNASIATAATIQNASLNTNATIQNSELDVNVTNTHVNVYDKLYDGSAWVNQLSDSSGRAIVLNKLHYSAADITALGSSTLVREWLSAYADGILEYKYVGSYDDEFEQEVYLTHPDLGDGNKCLKLIYSYSTENSQKVVKSVYASVVDWTFDNNVTGALTLTLGTVTSPNPSSAISVGTDICTIAVTNTGSGTVNISLSGTNASLYTLRNVTDGTTGSDLLYDAAKSFVLETASDFSGSSYSHSVTITATNNFFGNTASENVATSGTYTVSAYQNLQAATTSGTDTTASYVSFNNDNNVTNILSTDWSISFWFKSDTDLSTGTIAPGSPAYSYDMQFINGGYDSQNQSAGFQMMIRTNTFWIGYLEDEGTSSNAYDWWYLEFGDVRTDLFDGNWHHVALVHNGSSTASTTVSTFNSNITLYFDGSVKSSINTYTQGSDSNVSGQPSKLRFGKQPVVDAQTNNPTYTGVFRDEVDELAYWSGHDLTSSEVTAIYNSGTPTDLENTTGVTVPSEYYRFEETDLGYDEITDANTTNENNIQAVTLNSLDSVYVPSGSFSNLLYMDITDGGSLKTPVTNTDLNSSHSIMFRYKADAFTASSGTVAQYFGLVNTTTSQSYIGKTRQAGLHLQFRGNEASIGAVGSSGLSYAYLDSSMHTIDDGNWHTIFMVWDAPSSPDSGNVEAADITSHFSIYVDSYLDSSKKTYSGATDSSANLQWTTTIDQLRLGDFISASNEYGFQVDEVAYWRGHALTETERNLAYNSGTVVDLQNTTGLTVPTIYQRFEDSSNQNYDSISDGNLGTVLGGTSTSY